MYRLYSKIFLPPGVTGGTRELLPWLWRELPGIDDELPVQLAELLQHLGIVLPLLQSGRAQSSFLPR